MDIHTKVAADIYGVSESEITKTMRSMAKAVIFGIVYGISGFGLGENLEISPKEAKVFIEKYYELYPGVKQYMDKIIEETYSTGKTRTLLNRRRIIPELNSPEFMVRQTGERMALNTPIQGTSADIIKKAMVEIDKEFTCQNIKTKMVLQVHDELIFDVIESEKEKVEDLIKDTFENKGFKHSKRVNLINSYILVQKNFINHYENHLYVDGEIKNAFKIKKILHIETPYEYLIRMFKDYFYLKDLKKDSSDKEIDLDTSIKYYCFEKNHALKDGKELENLDEELLRFNLKYENHPQIMYLIDGEYEDILNLSPGTQTNILMEYLVYKDTDKPILIDQPEDNVDNQTIYNKLRVWFSNLKLKRQVIVVTHDANIVINADAENVIIANHQKKDNFTYCNGALEYGHNLEIASDILDGGKEAVKRRLMKYGE